MLFIVYTGDICVWRCLLVSPCYDDDGVVVFVRSISRCIVFSNSYRSTVFLGHVLVHRVYVQIS